MELTTGWRATAADDELRRAYPEVGYDDSAWTPVDVPGHWADVAELADAEAVLYRCTFHHDVPAAGERAWLTFDGVFYQSDIWLDGAYVGDAEGYFAAHSFDVTRLLADGTEHTLAVEVTCPAPGSGGTRRALLGILGDPTEVDTAATPGGEPRSTGGIWRPVHLTTSGAVHIDGLRVLCREAAEEHASLHLRAILDAAEAVTADVVITITDPQGAVVATREVQHALATGENRLDWTVGVDRPQLWWPHALGDAPLHDVRVEVRVDDRPSDHRQVRTGLRTVRLQNWILHVNGERLFCKGANVGPTRALLGDASPAEVRRDVELAKEVGLDLLRVRGHVAHPELYDAADEAGMLIWQDLPLHREHARSVRREAVRQARQLVDLAAHHPSIAAWCGHNEPDGPMNPPAGTSAALQILRHQAPTWNRTVLDRSVRRALERADDSRPAIVHSGVLPHPPQLDGTDSHIFYGWRRGDVPDLAALIARIPRLGRFVGELGAQAASSADELPLPEPWGRFDDDVIAGLEALGAEPALWLRTPPADHDDAASWVAATQELQARVVARSVSDLRRLMYNPGGGFTVLALADLRPGLGYGLLDHERRPKQAWHALRAVCRAVLLVTDPLPGRITTGAVIERPVHVVSSRRTTLEHAQVTATLTRPDGETVWRWSGDVEADSCGLVGTIRTTAGDEPGPLKLTLELDAGEDSDRVELVAEVVHDA
ncbi:MAG: hypothetical protein S0880_31255 [Actinomycetota bacterium]|nr:hypothetical protein [Actinomycetota bacterium]